MRASPEVFGGRMALRFPRLPCGGADEIQMIANSENHNVARQSISSEKSVGDTDAPSRIERGSSCLREEHALELAHRLQIGRAHV